MTSWREGLRAAFQRLGYTVHRWPSNRFDSMRDALFLLSRAGYRPRVVIGPRDLRLRLGDVIFARRDSALLAGRSWR
jgi:hypothetical protein